MEQRLNVITLGVSDVAASTAFYERLGWSPSKSASNERITFFQMGGAVLALYGREANWPRTRWLPTGLEASEE